MGEAREKQKYQAQYSSRARSHSREISPYKIMRDFGKSAVSM